MQIVVLLLVGGLVPGCGSGSGQKSESFDGVEEVSSDTTGSIGEVDSTIRQPPEMEMRDLAVLVNPLVGTDGSGNVIPGAQLPHGVVKLSPDSTRDAGDLLEYEYDDPEIHGFSHTHLHGGGGSGYVYNHLLVTPLVDQWGELPRVPVTIDHATEEAGPGYFAASLLESGTRVELTATRWVGFHRVTFPAAETAELRFDLAHSGGNINGTTRIFKDDSGGGRCNDAAGMFISIVTGRWQQEA